ISLLFLLATSQNVLATSIPVTTSDWTTDFQSQGAIDAARTTAHWQAGFIDLPEQNSQYTGSAVLWTVPIYFNEDILSLTLTANYFYPPGTSVVASMSFGDSPQEYFFDWNQPYQPSMITTKVRIKLLFATSDPTLTPKIWKLYLHAQLQDRSAGGVVSRDNTRVSNLQSMISLLKNYYKDFQGYPIVTLDKDSKLSQWRALKNTLDAATAHGYNKNYNGGFIAEPTGIDAEYQYGYLTDSSGLNYLFWTQRENSTSTQFKTSWQGTIFDINCTPPTFCLSSAPIPSIPAPPSTPQGPSINYFNNGSTNNNNDIVSSFTPEELRAQGISFIKSADSSTVWLQIKNKIIPVNSENVFQAMGGTWPSVTQINNLNHKSLARFVKSPNSATVYLVTSSGLKRPMLDMNMLKLYGSVKEITQVNDQIVTDIPDNYLIRAEGDDKVYLLDQNIIRWISSPDIMDQLGLNFDNVAVVNPSEIDSYFEGNPIF
ncbi:MAG: hypothetical protein NTY61_00095, partial [Candidatus Parcubacteria bacterium]|nr:hypothetical protein [Candidatus Parcubacteria bacterium]